VLVQGEDIWIRDNRVERLQIKAAGGSGCARVYVQDNHIVDPHNLGISFVVQTSDGVLREGYITGNIIENLPSSGGIFVGTDGERTPGDVCRTLILRDNVIRGAWSGAGASDPNCTGTPKSGGAAVGLILDVPVHAENWLIEGNVVDNTG